MQKIIDIIAQKNGSMNKGLKILMAVMAVAVGLYPSIYFIIDRRFGLLQSKTADLLSDTLWNVGFYTHIILGGVALLIGWWQFTRISASKRNLHRNIGKVYLLACLFSAIAGIYIAFFATSGVVASAGFICLGILWFCFTLAAYLQVKHGHFKKHQKLMIFSYACCFSAVTLRVWLPLLIGLFHEFDRAYQIVAWVCWVPNIALAFLITRQLDKRANINEAYNGES